MNINELKKYIEIQEKNSWTRAKEEELKHGHSKEFREYIGEWLAYDKIKMMFDDDKFADSILRIYEVK